MCCDDRTGAALHVFNFRFKKANVMVRYGCSEHMTDCCVVILAVTTVRSKFCRCFTTFLGWVIICVHLLGFTSGELAISKRLTSLVK